MVDDGAALVDVGGESTRPGAGAVSLDEELRRVVPVLEAIAGELPVSIDTSKAEVARRALSLGAIFVNDVTALRGDPELAGVVAESGAFLCLMHMLGEPRTMQDDPRYDDVVSEVARFLEERLAFAVGEGIPEERICLDPGIGFGKTVEHNVELIVAARRDRRPRPARGGRGVAEALPGTAPRRHRGDHRPGRGRDRRRRHRLRARCDDAPRARRPPACRGPRRCGRGGAVSSVTIELYGLELHGFHGVLEEERRDGQTFLFDLELDADVAAARSDDLAETIDYREIVACVREISDGRAFELLEALAEALADALLARFPVSRVRVRVRKPQVQLEAPVEYTAVTVERTS